MIVGIYRSRRNFGMFVPIKHGGVTYYAKVYRKFVKGIGRYGPLVVGLSWETDRGYLVTVEADRYIDLPHDMLSRLEVLYYRLYIIVRRDAPRAPHSGASHAQAQSP